MNHQQDVSHEETAAKHQAPLNSVPTEHENIRTSATEENDDTQPFLNPNYFSGIPHPFPVPQGYDMRSTEQLYRRPIHGGFYGRPRPNFYGGFGVPFLGGLASGLLISSIVPPYANYPYGGYYPPYYYQPPYYY